MNLSATSEGQLVETTAASDAQSDKVNTLLKTGV